MTAGAVSVGHPVDVASGAVTLTREDIWITGVLPLVWERHYNSALLNAPSTTLGPSWTTRYSATLARNGSDFAFLMPEGGVQVFSNASQALMRGEVVRDFGSFQELAQSGDRFFVTRWDVNTGRVERFVFLTTRGTDVWPLTSIEDLAGRALDIRRDDSGRLLEIHQRLEKRALQMDYDNAGRIVGVSFVTPDHAPEPLVRYEYDQRGMLSAASDALGRTDRYQYDNNALLSREILKDGGVFYFRYDKTGRCIKTSGLDRYDEKTLTYRDAIRWTEVIDSLGHISRYHWLPTGQILRAISPVGAVYDTRYDEYGRIIARIDPNGAVTSFEYDERGNRTRISRPLGHEIAFVFNAQHQYVSFKDPDGHVWTRTFDAYNQLSASQNPLGGRWTYTRDVNGNIVHVTNPNGAERRLFYAENGDLVGETDWEGNLTRYVTDKFGRLVERHDPLGGVTRITFDVLGHDLSTIYPDGSRTSHEYDVAGNIIRATDANGNTSTFRHGPCHRLLQREDALGHTVTYNWSTEPNRLDSIINEKGEVYQFVRDAAGRIVCERGFDGRELRLAYDPAGNCVSTINGLGEQTRYVVDELGRLRKKLLPDGTSEEWEYDLRGNPLIAFNASTRVTFERDALGRVTREQQDEYVLEREWDGMNCEIRLKTSFGLEVGYTRDRNGALSEINTAGRTLAFGRNSLGLETDRFLPGGTHLHQRYDAMTQLTEQRVTVNAPSGTESYWSSTSVRHIPEVVRRAYRYNAAGWLTTLDDSKRGRFIYRYDPSERLVEVARDRGASEAFAYDPAGNLTMIRAGDTTELLEYAAGSRLLSQATTRFGYDENGRRICKAERFDTDGEVEWQYRWDNQDQLAAVTQPDGAVWTYTYDAFGRRLRKQGPNADIRFVWDQDVIVHEIHNQSLKSTWIYEKHSMVPLYTLQGGAGFAVITDHLGTPKELVDSRGRVVWTIDLRAWGEPERQVSDTVDCPLRSRGQWADQESGLYYNRFRYYDPASGQFLSQDPLGIRGSLNFYRYVKNPVNWIDPFGLADAPPCGDDDDPAAAERARKDAERDMRAADRGLDAHDKEFYGGEGVIYLVPGSGTPSGKPYVGSADDLDVRAATATDGRDRSQAVPIGSYPIGDRDARRQAEQRAIDDMGGIKNLDNKRNEIRKK